MRLLWLLTALVLATLLAVVHSFALTEFLYWRFVWLDVPIHFLGGLTIGMLVIGASKNFRPVTFIVSMATVLLGWEAFEFFIQTAREANFIFDTTLDLLMGALGAVIAYLLARLTLWRSV